VSDCKRACAWLTNVVLLITSSITPSPLNRSLSPTTTSNLPSSSSSSNLTLTYAPTLTSPPRYRLRRRSEGAYSGFPAAQARQDTHQAPHQASTFPSTPPVATPSPLSPALPQLKPHNPALAPALEVPTATARSSGRRMDRRRRRGWRGKPSIRGKGKERCTYVGVCKGGNKGSRWTRRRSAKSSS
jgi:cell wall-associated NlpC family hydrolase